MNIVQLRLVVFTICLIFSMSTSAAVTNFALGEVVTGKRDTGVSIAFPDVCKTPTPASGPIPIPYPNIAMSGDKKTGSKKTKARGRNPAVTDSHLKVSTGDAGSVAGGDSSAKTRDKSDLVLYSFDVKHGGQLHIRQFDGTTPNKTGSNSAARQRIVGSQTTARTAPRLTPAPEDESSSVTEVMYVDASGKEIKLWEPTLIELTNGEYCAVCVANGKVTAIYRLLSATPKRKKLQAPGQNIR